MRKWLPVMIGVGVLMGASAFWYHSRSYAPSQLVQMLPPDRATHVYLNFEALRSAGILDVLAGSTSLEDADYKKFVEETGFDYRKDLDGLALAFRDGDVYYAAQGRFDWDKLAAYAPAHGGKCERFLCTTPGSEPGRNVSYYMPRNNILAMATSRTSTAGDMVAPGSWKNGPRIPEVGLWISAPPFAFSDLRNAPEGTRAFLSPLAEVQSSIVTLGPKDANTFELKLVATARDAQDAKKLADRYSEFTGLLIKMLERDKMTANPGDISGMLVAGKFEAKDAEVTATWPVSRALVESLASNVELTPSKKAN